MKCHTCLQDEIEILGHYEDNQFKCIHCHINDSQNIHQLLRKIPDFAKQKVIHTFMKFNLIRDNDSSDQSNESFLS